MTAVTIRWWRDERYYMLTAHATAGVGQVEQLDAIAGPLSPACMSAGSTIGGDNAKWVPAPYAKRCSDCVSSLRATLEAAIAVPTAPVLVRFAVVCLVDPDKVDHAHDLMRSYIARTPTFNQNNKAPEVAMVSEPVE